LGSCLARRRVPAVAAAQASELELTEESLRAGKPHWDAGIASLAQLWDIPVGASPPGADDAATTEVRTDLNKLLAILEPPQGDIIRALKVEGVSVAELAKKYSFTESKVKIIVHRGLHKLNALVTAGEISP